MATPLAHRLEVIFSSLKHRQCIAPRPVIGFMKGQCKVSERIIPSGKTHGGTDMCSRRTATPPTVRGLSIRIGGGFPIPLALVSRCIEERALTDSL
jgi:hypothetical protein